MHLSWIDLAAEPLDNAPFLIDPYVPRESIILLHGKYSTGKSPLTWELARCVGEGLPFFGHPSTLGRVLYLELDAPKIIIKKRLYGLPPAQNVWWLFLSPYPPDLPLMAAQTALTPALVIVDTLRKAYLGSDIESQAASRVYSRFRHLFPQAALLFVHHDRKDSTDPESHPTEDESFAGSQAWMNDVQVGLHLSRVNEHTFRVKHTKSQVSALVEPFSFTLDSNGVLQPDITARFFAFWSTLPESVGKTVRVRSAVHELGLSERTVWRLLRNLEGPGPAFIRAQEAARHRARAALSDPPQPGQCS